jgi:hypothetical protein
MWRSLKMDGEKQETDVLYLQWLNQIKLCRISENEKGRVQMAVIKTLDFQNNFIGGCTLQNDYYILFKF